LGIGGQEKGGIIIPPQQNNIKYENEMEEAKEEGEGGEEGEGEGEGGGVGEEGTAGGRRIILQTGMPHSVHGFVYSSEYSSL